MAGPCRFAVWRRAAGSELAPHEQNEECVAVGRRERFDGYSFQRRNGRTRIHAANAVIMPNTREHRPRESGQFGAAHPDLCRRGREAGSSRAASSTGGVPAVARTRTSELLISIRSAVLDVTENKLVDDLGGDEIRRYEAPLAVKFPEHVNARQHFA